MSLIKPLIESTVNMILINQWNQEDLSNAEALMFARALVTQVCQASHLLEPLSRENIMEHGFDNKYANDAAQFAKCAILMWARNKVDVESLKRILEDCLYEMVYQICNQPKKKGIDWGRFADNTAYVVVGAVIGILIVKCGIL